MFRTYNVLWFDINRDDACMYVYAVYAAHLSSILSSLFFHYYWSYSQFVYLKIWIFSNLIFSSHGRLERKYCLWSTYNIFTIDLNLIFTLIKLSYLLVTGSQAKGELCHSFFPQHVRGQLAWEMNKNKTETYVICGNTMCCSTMYTLIFSNQCQQSQSILPQNRNIDWPIPNWSWSRVHIDYIFLENKITSCWLWMH